jgi:glutamate-1-semialdehyde 2,1-aminomutase
MTERQSSPTSPIGFSQSLALRERALASLSGGVSTAFRLGERPLPLFFQSASGAHLVDVDGNTYLDFTCGFGPVILGHAHPTVAAAVTRAAGNMQQIGGQHEAEVELAEALSRLVPCFERVRPALSGSEAVHVAVRLSRAATGRPLVVKFAGHYHGWFDGIFASTASLPPTGAESAGQLDGGIADLRTIEWNDADQLQEIFAAQGDRIAALIMEPYPCNGGVIPPQPGFLELARQLTQAAGSILIFDEVISGFRIGLGGAQELLGVTPDLAIVAKALGNGFPISAFGGRADLMELVASNRVVHAGTYNGGGVSVAAALATVGVLEAEPVHRRLNELGTRLMDGLVDVAANQGRRLVAQGPGPVFFTWFLEEGEVRTYRDHLRADHDAYQRFAQAMLEEGVRLIPAGRWYLNAAHTEEDVETALAAADLALARI